MQYILLEDVEAGTNCDMGNEYIAYEEETSEAGRAGLASSSKKEFLYDSGNSSRSYKQFRSLVSAQEIVHVSQSALHLIELLDIDNTAKGAVETRAQYRARNQR